MSRELARLDKPIPPLYMAHFVLRTRDLQGVKTWYEKVLGARAVFENPVAAFLTFDREHHRLAIVQSADLHAADRQAVGVDHVAFTFSALGDLLHTYKRLSAESIKPYWCINHGLTTSLYYRDPDGNQVELQVDNFESVEELQGFFQGSVFQKNPIGVEFDPDKLLERWENGDPIEELAQQGSA